MQQSRFWSVFRRDDATAIATPTRKIAINYSFSLEGIAVDAFSVSSFELSIMHLFQPFFRPASWQSFLLLASGWAWARHRHTIASYLWLSGATAHKHFSRFYSFLGTALYSARLKL